MISLPLLFHIYNSEIRAFSFSNQLLDYAILAILSLG